MLTTNLNFVKKSIFYHKQSYFSNQLTSENQILKSNMVAWSIYHGMVKTLKTSKSESIPIVCLAYAYQVSP